MYVYCPYIVVLKSWYLYILAGIQNMLRTHEENRHFRSKENPISDCSRSDQMPYIDQIT